MATIYNITLAHIRQEDKKLRKSKVFCTLGPSCWSVEGLVSLLDAGMDVARFNFSHGDHKTHFAALERLRTALTLRPGKQCAFLLGNGIH